MFAKKGDLLTLCQTEQHYKLEQRRDGGTWMAALLAPTDYVNTNRLPGRAG